MNVHITRVGLNVSIPISVTDIEDVFNQDLVTITSHSTQFKREDWLEAYTTQVHLFPWLL
jgi:hypothetical protein